jgi:hypothetical protein
MGGPGVILGGPPMIGTPVNIGPGL